MFLHIILLTNTKINQTSSPVKSTKRQIEPDEIKSYIVPVSNIDGVKLRPNIIVLKN